MAFLATTPQEDIAAVVQQTGEQAKSAMLWFAVIAVIVLLIMFGSKK
jgi:LPXTG-motif cell wall-anchored protein